VKRVLIVSPYFPPSTVAGVHRARILARHLPQWGWEPVVFCVHERFHEQRLDWDLAELVGGGARVVKVGAWPTRWSRRVGIGDLGMRGYGALKRAVSGCVRDEGADLLFITVLPGLPIAMAPRIKRAHGLPFVVDYQDPWLPRGHEQVRPLTKRWAVHQLARWIEPRVLRQADHITTVSDGTSALIRSRYPFLGPERFTTHPIGGDPLDFAFLAARQRPCPWVEQRARRVNICYVGNVWERALRTLRAVFDAAALLRERRPDVFGRLHFVFVGSSNQPDAAAAEVALPIARAAGIAELVSEEPSRVPYLDALNVLLQADVILMIGSDDPHYTASKLYPVLLARRPVLGVFHEASSVCEIAEAVGGGRLVTFGEGAPVEARIGEIADALVETVEAPGALGSVDEERLAPYLAPSIAKGFARVFDAVVEGHGQ